MSGTSYLAIAQWFTAAEQPPHLAAINPWEGVSDVYRDLVMRGGMPDTGFARTAARTTVSAGKSRKEDILPEAERYPLMNDLWENKIPKLDKITVPAYVVASYSNTLHTAGTFRAWRRIASQEKWLRIHNTPGMARLLRRSKRRRPAPLLRPLPQGRGQRLGADPPRPLLRARPRGRRPARSGGGRVPPAGRHLHEVLPRRRLADTDHRAAGRRGDRRPTTRNRPRPRSLSSSASTRKR